MPTTLNELRYWFESIFNILLPTKTLKRIRQSILMNSYLMDWTRFEFKTPSITVSFSSFREGQVRVCHL